MEISTLTSFEKIRAQIETVKNFYVFYFRCWAANIQIRPNMSDVVEQIREIQRFFPEASDPLVFSEGILRDRYYHKIATYNLFRVSI